MTNTIGRLSIYGPIAAALSFAAPASASFMSRADEADAPHGFLAMCARDPEACETATAGTSPPASVDERALVHSVNRYVNRTVLQTHDSVSAGTDELWQRPDFSRRPTGDCEDLALEKQARLAEAGFPAERLFLAVAYIPRTGLHTVLIARLPEGDYVLDSRNSRLRRWDAVRYQWLRMQSARDPVTWYRVASAGERRREATRLARAAPAPREEG